LNNRDDDGFKPPYRHLRLVSMADSRNDKIDSSVPRLPAARRPARRTPARPIVQIRHEAEIPIKPSRDAAVGRRSVHAPMSAEERESHEVTFDRLAAICERIASGHYNTTEVLDVVARRLVESGALQNGSDER
jgi:hypothetical protein